MLLEHKNAIIYGGGAIGGAVARAFAGAGANVYLAGRTLEKLDAVAGAIRAAGGEVQTAQVDALDETAVDRRADTVVAQAGTINISFHVIAHPSVHGTPLAEMSVKDFMQPIEIAVRTTFLTTRAAARHMIQQKSGVMLLFGGSGDPIRNYYIGGTQVVFEAREAMRRQLAIELGQHGIRTVTLKNRWHTRINSRSGNERSHRENDCRTNAARPGRDA
jgi:NAD(P)-dependent dehydrogenase (short-subunit alcohol dehydrogenase family)